MAKVIQIDGKVGRRARKRASRSRDNAALAKFKSAWRDMRSLHQHLKAKAV